MVDGFWISDKAEEALATSKHNINRVNVLVDKIEKTNLKELPKIIKDLRKKVEIVRDQLDLIEVKKVYDSYRLRPLKHRSCIVKEDDEEEIRSDLSVVDSNSIRSISNVPTQACSINFEKSKTAIKADPCRKGLFKVNLKIKKEVIERIHSDSDLEEQSIIASKLLNSKEEERISKK